MRTTTLAIALVLLAQGLAVADEFQASIFWIEGSKIYFVKPEKSPKSKGIQGARPTSLTLADKVLVLHGGKNEETKKYEGAIVEAGLNYPLFKSFKLLSKAEMRGAVYHHAELATNADNQVAEIRLRDDLAGKIMKVDGRNLTIIQIWGSGFYGGNEEGIPRSHYADENIKVVKGWLNPETRKFEATEVEGGLKNEMFKSVVRARYTSTTTPDGKTQVTLIRVFDIPKKSDDN